MMKMMSKIVITLIFILSVIQNSDGLLELHFCVANEQIPEEQLVNAMNWACGNGADCGPIQEHGDCFFPNTVKFHASYAFNSYYQNMKYQAGGTCYFNAAAILTTIDPSQDTCRFEGEINYY